MLIIHSNFSLNLFTCEIHWIYHNIFCISLIPSIPPFYSSVFLVFLFFYIIYHYYLLTLWLIHFSSVCVGNLFTERQLDRESLALHTLKLSVMDEGGRASFTTVRLIVHDKNDNPPIFTLPEYQSNINTDVAPGTTILKVRICKSHYGMSFESNKCNI